MNDYKVVRTFHPIGQGGFYSEKHNNFNVVYDCGAMPLTKYAKSVIETAFTKDEDIDALFISHFDYDHVSGIATLRDSVRTIKRVFLPLLDINHKKILININRALSQNIITLIDSPESFFGNATEVIYIRPNAKENSNDSISFNFFELPRGLKKDREIDSGSRLSLGGNFSWIFVPYNHQNQSRSKALVRELKREKFDVQQLQSNAKYSIKNISTPSLRKKLRKIYTRLNGNVNENSMLVYSGLDNRCLTKDIKNQEYNFTCDCTPDTCHPNNCCFFSGCIYTGDTDLNKVNVGEVFYEYAQDVTIVQIPHHGSKHNFDITSLDKFYPFLICPISYGTSNNYGHPSTEVVNELSLDGSKPVLVNEHPKSKFVHEIKFFNRAKMKAKYTVESFSNE